MKNLALESEKILHRIEHVKNVMCHSIMTPDGYRDLQQPFVSSEHRCEYCGGGDFHTPLKNQTPGCTHRAWLCGNVHCAVYTAKKHTKTTQTTAPTPRALEWPLFCETNDVGDLWHSVRFEDIHQPIAKIEYLRKFAMKPFGIIHMQGPSGCGKTYAALATCELFTRTNLSAKFITQTKMQQKWLSSEKTDFVEWLEKVQLLVIDDFATGEVPNGFMKFFMDLINTRIQWTNRGTIITTNLSDKQFMEICGEALTDKINTGQRMIFKDSSRRTPIII